MNIETKKRIINCVIGYKKCVKNYLMIKMFRNSIINYYVEIAQILLKLFLIQTSSFNF